MGPRHSQAINNMPSACSLGGALFSRGDFCECSFIMLYFPTGCFQRSMSGILPQKRDGEAVWVGRGKCRALELTVRILSLPHTLLLLLEDSQSFKGSSSPSAILVQLLENREDLSGKAWTSCPMRATAQHLAC